MAPGQSSVHQLSICLVSLIWSVILQGPIYSYKHVGLPLLIPEGLKGPQVTRSRRLRPSLHLFTCTRPQHWYYPNVGIVYLSLYMYLYMYISRTSLTKKDLDAGSARFLDESSFWSYSSPCSMASLTYSRSGFLVSPKDMV